MMPPGSDQLQTQSRLCWVFFLLILLAGCLGKKLVEIGIGLYLIDICQYFFKDIDIYSICMPWNEF